MMITSKHETVGKWGLLRSPIRLRGSEQSDPWCNFYLELAPDKENPGAKRRRGWRGNSLFPPNRWTLSGALRIIFTCGHRCFVDGRIHALIKLMQPNLCARPPTELCPPACLGLVRAPRAPVPSCPCGRGRQGDFYGTLHTFETCGNACRTGSVLASRVLTITFLPDWLREKWLRVNLENRLFRYVPPPPSHGKQKYFPRLFGYRAAVPIFLRTFVIHFSMTTKNS